MDAKLLLALALGGGVVYYLGFVRAKEEEVVETTTVPSGLVKTNPLVIPPALGIGALIVAVGLAAWYADPYRS